jgi:hypothetical protein
MEAVSIACIGSLAIVEGTVSVRKLIAMIWTVFLRRMVF